MDKEQIQQKFDKILLGLGYKFYSDEGNRQEKHFYRTKDDMLDLMESCFNLGLEVAANNAEADVNIISTETGDYSEIYVLKESILKFKL